MENLFFLFFSISVLILPLFLILLYELHFCFVQSSPYDAVFHIWDQNNVDKTSELWLSLSSACAVFRLFLALSLFHTFSPFLLKFCHYFQTVWLLPFKSRFFFPLYLNQAAVMPLRKAWKRKSRWLCRERLGSTSKTGYSLVARSGDFYRNITLQSFRVC